MGEALVLISGVSQFGKCCGKRFGIKRILGHEPVRFTLRIKHSHARCASLYSSLSEASAKLFLTLGCKVANEPANIRWYWSTDVRLTVQSIESIGDAADKEKIDSDRNKQRDDQAAPSIWLCHLISPSFASVISPWFEISKKDNITSSSSHDSKLGSLVGVRPKWK